METMVEPQAQRRLTLVAWFGVIWGVILIGRLFHLHVLEHDNLRLVAKGQTMHTLVAKSGKQVVVMLSRKPIPPTPPSSRV